MKNSRTLKIHPNDNVFVALSNLNMDDEIICGEEKIKLVNDIPAKHKFAAKDFQKDDDIIMYGILVGKAVSPIPKGGLLSTRNVRHKASNYSGRTTR